MKLLIIFKNKNYKTKKINFMRKKIFEKLFIKISEVKLKFNVCIIKNGDNKNNFILLLNG